jgi:transcriptional regulator with XRE-family HTH domain
MFVPISQRAFSEYLRLRMEELGFNPYDVARESGGALSSQTVWAWLNEPSNDIKLSTMEALAKGVHVPPEEMFDAARGKGGKRLQSIPELRAANYFKELPLDKQADVLLFLQSLHRQHGAPPAALSTSKVKKGRTA